MKVNYYNKIMPYSTMTSTTFDEATYISAALDKIYYDCAKCIDRIILDHYMQEIGHDLAKEAAIFESYLSTANTPYRTLYDILYFKVNNALDSEEMGAYYSQDDNQC